MEILSIDNLHKRFGDKTVLSGVNLSVKEKSIFGFVGQNGAGKTTTMKSILGLLRPDAGAIYVDGERVEYGQTVTNRLIGYLPDVPEFYPFMTAREYLSLCGESLNMDARAIRTRSDELLERVGLLTERHRIGGYSRGMKQRLGIAQALLGRPRLLISDEPTSALDPVGRREILDILLSVREETTVLFSTHILSDVERICTDFALLHDGRIVIESAVHALKGKHDAERFTVELATEAATKQLAATFADARPAERDVLLFSGGEGRMYEVLDYIRREGLPLSKIERQGLSLEALFMEVTKK